MHERGLHVDAQQYAEPHEVDAEFAGDRGQQRDDDEGDLEKIEEEGQEEHEDVDEHQEADDAAGQPGEHVFDPARAVHALEHQAEAGRADQDEHHHRGDAHGRGHALLDQRPGQPAVQRGQHHGAHRAHGAGFGRRGEAEADGPEHQEDQHDGGDHAPQHPADQFPGHRFAFALGDRRHRIGTHERQQHDVDQEDRHLQHRRADGAEVHVADRAPELVGQHDQHQRGRDQLGDGAGRGDHAGGELHVVAVTHHDRQRDHAHGDHGCRDRAGDGAEDGADDDHRVGDAAGDLAEQLPGALQQVFGEAAALQDRAHEGEERNRQQQVVGNDAVEAERQCLQEGRVEVPGGDADQAEEQADRGEREGHRKPDQHEQDHGPEHERGHDAVRKH